jgi:hypothetical protein
VYLASSVVTALKENRTLSISGLEMITCPVKSCVVIPERCTKGQTQLCKKKIDVVYEHEGHNKVAVLVFYYQHRTIAREGFIKKNDLALGILLKRNIINL